MKKINCKDGSTLLEVLIALAIFSITMFGMTSAALQSLSYTRKALLQTQALITPVNYEPEVF